MKVDIQYKVHLDSASLRATECSLAPEPIISILDDTMLIINIKYSKYLTYYVLIYYKNNGKFKRY